jgi:hypothetical protein
MNQLQIPSNARPWWKHGYLWLIISGPLVVVIASFITLYLAIKAGDTDQVYKNADGVHALMPAEEAAQRPGSAALTPALQARNHAATGGVAH